MQYCSLQHWTFLLSPVTSTAGYCFFLWLHPFILSGDISPLISSSILGTYRPGEFLFWYPIILPFHTVHGVLKRTGMAWFHWVRQGCSPRVIRLTSFLWVWFQFVCPMMPSCNIYHLTWVSLTLSYPMLKVRKGGGEEIPLIQVRSSGCTLLEQPWRNTLRPR